MSAVRFSLLSVFTISTLFVLAASPANGQSIGTWTPTTNYPLQVAAPGCAVVGGDAYCVGGFDSNFNSYDDVSYAPLGNTGVGAWATGTTYPTAVDSESCVNASSTIYCIGGEDGSVGALDSVYYSQVPSSGAAPGSWTAAATYPAPTVALSCVVSGAYIYCVGGFDVNGNEVSSAYYAALGTPGISSWTSTTSYPKAVDSESCAASGGYIYCVGGEVANGGSNVPINNVYYAQLTASGIGKWSSGPAYPASLAALSCVPSSGYIYCVGGFDNNQLSSSDAYYAQVSSSGVGAWTGATAYPVPIDTATCVLHSSDIFCFGGVSATASNLSNVNYAYYVSVGGATVTSTPEFPMAATVPITLGALLGAVTVVLRRVARS